MICYTEVASKHEPRAAQQQVAYNNFFKAGSG